MERHILFVLFLVIFCTADKAFADEDGLFNKLFHSGYNKHIRPIIDHTQPVKVTLEFELIKIIGLSEIDEVLTVVGIFVATWTDEHMKWTPARYGGIESFVVPPTDLWLPDIGLENSADSFYHDTFTKDFRVRIFHDGHVQWTFGGQVSTTCGLDMTYYPFDWQKCVIQMENWAYHGDEVQLRNTHETIAMDAYEPHGVWEITETESSWKNVYFLATGPEPYPEVDFVIYLKRKPNFYIMNLILPCILMVGVALSVFWLPTESGEKASLGVTVLLAFSVLQIVLMDGTPTSSDYNPVLALMVTAIMTLSAISVLTTILVLYLYHKDSSHRVPLGIRRVFFRGLAPIVCMRSSVPDVTSDKVKPVDTTVTMQDMDEASSDKAKMVGNFMGNGNELASIAANLDYISGAMREKEASEVIIEEWRALSRVLDRILFWICFIIVVIILAVFMTRKDKNH